MTNTNYDDCPELLKDFLNYIATIKNLSPNTIDSYYLDLKEFLRFLKRSRKEAQPDTPFTEIIISDISKEDLEKVTVEEVYDYLTFTMRELNNVSRSRARKVTSLRSFYKYLTVKSHKFENDPVKNIEMPKVRAALPKYLTLDESLALLETPEGEHALRDYCILTLFLNCGMRLSELVGINVNDVRDDQLRLLGKGNKERIVFLNRACRDAVSSYIEQRDKQKFQRKDPRALFLSRTGSRLTARRVEQIVDECLKRAGLSDRGFSTHKLRHTAATLMYRYGDVDMLALKEILGHAHVSTTEIYTHINDEKLKAATDSNPLAREKRTNKPKAAGKSEDFDDESDN